MEQRVYLYGFNDLFRVVDAKYLREGHISTWSMDRLAERMFDANPGIDHIYAVNNRPGLREDFLDTIIRPHYTKDIEFEELIYRERLRNWER